jgi:hypothetical protein
MPDHEQTPDQSAPETGSLTAAQAQAQQILTDLAGSQALIPQEAAEGETPPPEDAIALPVIEQDGTHFVPVFTSVEKLVSAGADPDSAVQVGFAQLGAAWPSDELWLAVDPANEDGLTLPPDVVRALPTLVAG